MPTQAHRELLAWLDARADETAREAADLIFEQIPHYRDVEDEQLFPDVVAHCRNVMQILLRVQREGRGPGSEDFDWTSAQAVRRVSVGLEITEFLRGFRLAQLTTWNQVQAAVAEHPEWTPVALEMVDPIMRVYEMGSKVAAVAWMEAQRWQVAGVERLRADLLEDLVAGRVPTVPARRRALQDCGLTGASPFLVAIVSVGGDVRLPESMDPISEAYRELSATLGGLVVVKGEEVYGVLPATGDGAGVASSLERVHDQLRGRGIGIRGGLSSNHEALTDVPLAVAEARRARELVRGTGVVRLADLTLLDYLVQQADQTALRVIDAGVRDVLEHDLHGHRHLVDTLDAYLRGNLNAKVAAEELNVHANTVYYRLERFGERTGVDVRHIDALVEVLLARRLVERWSTGTSADEPG